MIELLVVIAIISLLVSLLLPLLTRARDLARAVVCMTNLRQLMTACVSYAQEYDGRAPAAFSGTWEAPTYWTASLAADGYVSAGDGLVCPSYRQNQWLWWSQTYGLNRGWPWMNGQGGRSKSEWYGVDQGIPLDLPDYWDGAQMATTHPNTGQKSEPYAFPVLGDSLLRGTQNDEKCWDFLYPLYGSALVHLRHAEAANIAFADGRVESCDEASVVADDGFRAGNGYWR